MKVFAKIPDLIVRVSARLVPHARRSDFLREWESELWHRRSGVDGSAPEHSLLGLALGSVPHAIVEFASSWSLKGLIRDIAYAVRLYARSPGFTMLTITVIALGIGVNTAIFTVVDGVLIRPLPFDEPEQLVLISADDPANSREGLDVRYDDLMRLSEDPAIVGMVPFQAGVTQLRDSDGPPTRVSALDVTADVFALLGVTPIHGPGFGQTIPGETRQMMISESMWRSRYGASAVVGRIVVSGGREAEVVGVFESGLPEPLDVELVELFTPLVTDTWRVRAYARLDGERFEAAVKRLETNRVSATASFNDFQDNLPVSVEPLAISVTDSVRRPIILLYSAVSLLLLLACLNVANLLLVRGSVRATEWTVRHALGASRSGLARQALTESVTIALAGGVAGIAASFPVLAVIRMIAPVGLPRMENLGLSWRTALFGLLLSTIAGFMMGLIPAFKAVSAVRDGGPQVRRYATSGRATRGAQRWLVTCEVSLATVLVLSAGLLVTSLLNVFAVDPGFDRSVVTVRTQGVGAGVVAGALGVAPGANRDSLFAVHRKAAWNMVLESIENLPGVTSVGVAALHPMETGFEVNFSIPANVSSTDASMSASFMPVDGDYLGTLGLELSEGRMIGGDDTWSTPAVTVVNETFVKRYLGDLPAVGTVIRKSSVGGPWGAQPEMTIVGVMRDVQMGRWGAGAQPIMLVPLEQGPFGYLRLFIKADVPASQLADPVRRIVWDVDPTVPVESFETLEATLHDTISESVFLARVMTGFAFLALTLAMIGVYGVLSFLVASSTREIGIRKALGAEDRAVRGAVLGDAIRMGVVGLGLGMVGFAAAGRLIRSFLFEIQPSDPTIMGLVFASMMIAVVLAALIPSRRALAVDPVEALRQD